MEANNRMLYDDIIKKTDVQYTIPVYQRNYTWEKENCELLYNDIVSSIKNEKNHFLGSLVYSTTKRNDIKSCPIIDGQQRLTTIMLLLKAIDDLIKDPDNITKKKIRKNIYNENCEERYKLKLKNSDNDNKTILYNENKNIVKKENFTIKSDRLSILDLLMNLFIWFLKFIFIIFMFPIIMSIIGGVICFVLLIILIFKGLFLIGPIIISLSLVVFSIMIMEILFNFIVNKKTNFKRIFIVCISSIVLASIGIGLSIGYFSNIEIINKAPNQYEIETKEEIIPMNDKLFMELPILLIE